MSSVSLLTRIGNCINDTHADTDSLCTDCILLISSLVVRKKDKFESTLNIVCDVMENHVTVIVLSPGRYSYRYFLEYELPLLLEQVPSSTGD